MPSRPLCIQLPQRVLERLDYLEQKYGMRKEDIVVRVLVKVLDEDFK